MNIDQIVIGDRVRKDMGDLQTLADSIKRNGLLHPVVVKTDNTLVAGHRRIEAVRMIGWSEIPVTVIDVDDLLSAERDENSERKDFTPTEAVAIGRLIEARHQEKVIAQERARKSQKGTERYTPLKNQGLTPLGERREAAANAVGMGGSRYDKAKAVVTAAERDPENFGDLPKQMDETNNVGATHSEMQRRRGAAKRSAIHNKTPYPKPNKEVDKAVAALDGICYCLSHLPVRELHPVQVPAWIAALKKSASTITKFTRSLSHVKG